MTSTAILIPARYDSTRFPGKPLELLNGVPLITHVWKKCKEYCLDTFVVTDSRKVAHCVPYDSVIYTGDASNGTERCSLAIDTLQEYDQFVNVQGDMPDVTPEIIDKVIWHLQHYSVTTVFTDMPKEKQDDPNSVKMIRAGDQALWFGRGMTGYGDWHLGVYGYRRNALDLYPTLKIEKEEEIEQLEQLRWLKNGWQIGCLKVQYKGVEINTPEDLEEWHKLNYQ